MFIFYWISFEYSGYRASYFLLYNIYLYLYTYSPDIYIFRSLRGLNYVFLNYASIYFFSLRINLNTVIFKFYIIHVCIRILYYIHLPAWSASRCHKYFLICCTFFMPFYKYSNTFDSTLFYIYVSLLYMCAERCVLFITYLCAIFL